MKFIANFADIIQDEWIDHLLSNNGQLLPDTRECLLPDFDEQNVAINKAWGKLSNWHKFEIQDMPFTIPWPVELSNKIDWWVIKMMPGQCIPVHIDANPDTAVRYVMAMQDYIPGHVLIWNGKMLDNYRKGDLFKVDDVNASHGSCNISNVPRLMAHLTVWN